MPPCTHRPGKTWHRPALLALHLAWLSLAAPVAEAAPWKVRADTQVQLELRQIGWRLQGPFAEQRVELVLRNPSNRPMEATVLLPLADGERLRGYALDINGELRDAVPVERVQARVAFETQTALRVDPALVERDSDSDYRLRVFPIPARGERRLRIDLARLAERSDCGWRHTLSADALPEGSQLAATLSASLKPVLVPEGLDEPAPAADKSASAAAWTATLPLRSGDAPRTVCLPAPGQPAGFTHRLDDGTEFRWLEVPMADAGTQPLPAPSRLEIVWDASLRMPGDRLRELQLLDSYLRGRSLSVTLTVLRLGMQRQQFQVRNGDWTALRETLLALKPEGALDLGSWSPAAGAQQVLMFSELRHSWPHREALKSPGLPVHLVSRQVADMALAQPLLQDGGQWLDLKQASLDELARQLTLTPGVRIASRWDQAAWHAESRTPRQGVLRACHVQPADEAWRDKPALLLSQQDAQGRRERGVQAEHWTPEPLAAFWCGSWWIQTLEVEPLRNKRQLARLGEQLGLVNRETSLLVLETLQDYINHGVMPPGTTPAIREAVLRGREARAEREREQSTVQRRALALQWSSRERWWSRDFSEAKEEARHLRELEALENRQARERERLERQFERTGRPAPIVATQFGSPPPPAFIRPPEVHVMPAPTPAPKAESPPPRPVDVPAPHPALPHPAAPTRVEPPREPAPSVAPAAAHTLRAVATTERYAAELAQARTAEALDRLVADLSGTYADSPAFHADVAERFAALGRVPRAVQVLSNIVALMPREASALRLVAYRLQGMGQAALALDLLLRARDLAPDEPQSWRDAGLALGQAGRCDEAAASLQHVMDTAWPDRFAEIALISLAELNDLQQRCPSASVSTLPEALRKSLPVGLRVVMRWDLNSTDIDLHVIDPLNEEAFFMHRDTRQGGHLSRDFTAGYGPEEFIVRQPLPGRYKVVARYYGSQRATLSRGATVQVDVQTGFGSPQLKTRTMTFRLVEGGGDIELGEFHLDAKGRLIDPPAPAPGQGKGKGKGPKLPGR
ncbi:VIT domain-containing protein [Pelomonas sp. APW6]|uniref:VIT domain-containing protein n=1 Tax=Roseateles subflavus TaxID=3053353 RepID=A0ABT7LCD2_9BURK|nr:VIT domain-containing protein [Pelomonas sp. APW6]MDL5030512.1 VIT domain-containing protein [Pelomonas sp. APW6]